MTQVKIGRRSFLKVAAAATAGLAAAPLRRTASAIAAPAWTPAPPVLPWGLLEVYTGAQPRRWTDRPTGMLLCRLPIPTPPDIARGGATFSTTNSTAVASGTPGHARICVVQPDGSTAPIVGFTAGILDRTIAPSQGLAFASVITAGGTVAVRKCRLMLA